MKKGFEIIQDLQTISDEELMELSLYDLLMIYIVVCAIVDKI